MAEPRQVDSWRREVVGWPERSKSEELCLSTVMHGSKECLFA